MNNNEWIIQEDSLLENDLLKNESLFHIANGYVGMRGNFEEGYNKEHKTIRGTYINGFYDIGVLRYTEKFVGYPEEYQKMVNIVDIQGIELYIDGERFSLFDGKVLYYKRTLDMKKGHVIRHIIWNSNKGHEIEITIKRMASFVVLEMLTIEYIVKSINFNGNVKLVSTQIGSVNNFADENDPRLAQEVDKNIIIDGSRFENRYAIMDIHTKLAKIKLTSIVNHKFSKEANFDFEVKEEYTSVSYETDIKTGEVISLEKYGVFADSRRYEDPNKKAIEIMNKINLIDLNSWYKQQEIFLGEFWGKSNVIIYGDEDINKGIRYNIFGLLQSVGKDRWSNIAAKGLSGEGYEGHYFWDTEIYMFPFFLLTERKIALNLLKFRYNILDSAKEHAKLLGHRKGALYPWRTITGSECSSYFPSGSAQYHINGDVAYTFIQYYLVTKDINFVKDMAAEVLFEIARLWMSVGHFQEDNYKIDCVTGPDEYTCLVNNNYYTNAVAKYSLYWAYKFYYILENEGLIEFIKEKLELSSDEIEMWKKASDSMYLPVDKEKNINPQDDSFLFKKKWDFKNTTENQYPLLLNFHPLYIYRHQVLKQADTVLSHFLLEDYQSIDVIKNSYNYYEKITTHDSSLSTCIYSIVASRLGYHKKAYNYFKETATLDLDDTHGNTHHGIHTANMGGAYMSIVYGFAGLRIKEDGLSLRPYIPSSWKGYEFKINYLESLFSIKVDEKGVYVKLISGEPINIVIKDKTYLLADYLEIHQ